MMPNRLHAGAIGMLMFGGEPDLGYMIHHRATAALASGSKKAVQELDVNQDHMVTSDQIKHIRDTLVRADCSLKKAKTNLLLSCEEIHVQQATVREAMVALDNMTSQKSG